MLQDQDQVLDDAECEISTWSTSDPPSSRILSSAAFRLTSSCSERPPSVDTRGTRDEFRFIIFTHNSQSVMGIHQNKHWMLPH